MDKKQTRVRALQRQIARLDQRLRDLHRVSDRLGWARLAVFVGGCALSAVFYYAVGNWLFWVGLILTAIGFAVTIGYQRRIGRGIARYTVWKGLKAAQIARMGLDWPHVPVSGDQPRPDHPFENDLDIVGVRSIHRLIDTTVSRQGSQRLRQWLTETHPALADTQRRQAQVKEIVPLPLFRDKLALAAVLSSSDPHQRWNGDRLLSWLQRPVQIQALRVYVVGLAIWAVVDLLLFALNGPLHLPNLWQIIPVLYFGITMVKLRELGDLFDDALTLQEGLAAINAVFVHMESYRYGKNEHLKTLVAPFLDPKHRPSSQLKRVTGIVAAVSIHGNPLMWLVINLLMPWDLYFADRLIQCKAEIAGLLPGWLDVWYEVEALNALANFNYINPAYTFPDVEEKTDPLFRGSTLGHPLIADDQRVCNDFTVDKLGQVGIITGSNMAGKSSFLRTLGVNLCLAYAGGPVNAIELTIPVFRLFTCIKVSDSVQDGLSYFYAEVRRLKALLNALDQPDDAPLFFLIDEIFRGTNNRERLIGSRSYIRALVGRNGIGVISTHDLELIKLAEEFAAVTNYHFREEVLDGRMLFDYHLRPGPSPTTNALKIMRMEGLPVDEADL